MMDAAEIVSVFFFVVVVVIPYGIYLFTTYEEPPSFAVSLRRNIGFLVIVCATSMLINFARFGTSFEEWRWRFAVAALCAVPVILAIDWLVLRHSRLRKSL